jgi:hypothetical protein
MAETKAPAATSSSGVSGTKAAAAAGAAAAHQEPQPQHTNYLLVASYATIFALWGFSQVVYIPYVLHLLTLVTAILYCACHSSLILRKEDAPPAAANDSSEHGSETTSRSTERETLRAEDAYQFPLVGSVSLFSLYLAFKFLDESLVNFMIGAYFAVVGCIALTMTLAGPVSRVTPVAFQRNFSYEYKIKHGLPEWIAGESPWELSLEFNGAELLSFIGAATICAFYFQSKRVSSYCAYCAYCAYCMPFVVPTYLPVILYACMHACIRVDFIMLLCIVQCSSFSLAVLLTQTTYPYFFPSFLFCLFVTVLYCIILYYISGS